MRTSSEPVETEAGNRGPSVSRVKISRLCYFTLLLVILFFSAVRFRLRSIPLERDEGEFAYMGQLILQGVPPYQLAANMKLPGTYAAYAVIMAVFGQSAGGIHLGLLFVNAVTIALMFLLGKRLYGPVCGLVTATVYALLSARVSVLGLSAHATHFVVLFAITGILAYLRSIQINSNQMQWLFISGLFLGLAFLMKQPGILLAVFVALDLIARGWKSPKSTSARSFAIYGAGVLLPFAYTCLALRLAGLFRSFWFWTFSYALRYATRNTILSGWQAFRQLFFHSIARPPALWIVAVLTFLALLLSRRKYARFVAGFAVFSFLAVCPGFYFRPHYFIVLLPAISLLCGMAVVFAAEYLRARQLRYFPAWLPVLVFALFFVMYVAGQRNILWKMSPLEVCRDEYPSEPYPEAITVAEYLSKHVPEGNTIAVLGSEPEIYFYSHRHSATTFIYTHPFSEDQPYAELMQDYMIREIENAKPAALVYVDDQLSWGWTKKSKPQIVFAWMRQYIPNNYELAAAFSFSGNVEHLQGATPGLTVYLRRP